MVTEASRTGGPGSRSRLYWLTGVLAVVAIVYLSLPKSWFEIPKTKPRPVAAPSPAPSDGAQPPSLITLRDEATQHPLDFGARSRYGMALAAAGRGMDALKEFQAAARLAPEQPGVYYNLGVFYLNGGQLDRAEDAFNRQLELTPGDGRAHYYLGLICERRHLSAQATAQFRLAHALAPGFPDAYLSLAMQLTRQNPEESQRLIADYVRLTGNQALADYVLSGAYKTRQQYDEAARYAEMTVKLEPNNFGYWHNLGQIYFYAGRTPDADSALNRALALAQSPTTVLIELGMNAQKGNRYSEAITYLQKALASSPKTGFIHLYLARLYPRVGNEAAAQREEATFRQWQRSALARPAQHGTTPATTSSSAAEPSAFDKP